MNDIEIIIRLVKQSIIEKVIEELNLIEIMELRNWLQRKNEMVDYCILDKEEVFNDIFERCKLIAEAKINGTYKFNIEEYGN